MLRIQQLMFLFFAIAVIYGCKKSVSPKIPMEVVTGYCYRYDIERIKSTDHAGITVSINGDSVSTTTNSNGSWIISDLKTGTYTFTFSNPGFGTMKVFGRRLIGGYQSLDDVSLYPVPLYTITLSTDSVSSDGFGVYLYGFFSGPVPLTPCLHLFFGKNKNVSSDPAGYIYDLAMDIEGALENVEFEIVFPAEIFISNGFHAGDTAYVGAYTDCLLAQSYNSNAKIFYTDPNTDQKIYPNLNPARSNILSFVLK